MAINFNGASRKHGGRDLVTILSLQESSGLAYRAAINDGHRTLDTLQQYSFGSADRIASRLGIEVEPNYGAIGDLNKSFRNFNFHAFGNLLEKKYTVHPDSKDDLKYRVFVYSDQLKVLVLQVPATLKYCFIKQEDPKHGAYEAILEAENELGENPGVLRDASKGFNENHYIWHISRKK